MDKKIQNQIDEMVKKHLDIINKNIVDIKIDISDVDISDDDI